MSRRSPHRTGSGRCGTYLESGLPPATPVSGSRSPARGHWTGRPPASPSPVKGRQSTLCGPRDGGVPRLLRGERRPYLVSGNGKGALAVWGQKAVHPSEALLLVASAGLGGQAGTKHTRAAGGAGHVFRPQQRGAPLPQPCGPRGRSAGCPGSQYEDPPTQGSPP